MNSIQNFDWLIEKRIFFKKKIIKIKNKMVWICLVEWMMNRWSIGWLNGWDEFYFDQSIWRQIKWDKMHTPKHTNTHTHHWRQMHIHLDEWELFEVKTNKQNKLIKDLGWSVLQSSRETILKSKLKFDDNSKCFFCLCPFHWNNFFQMFLSYNKSASSYSLSHTHTHSLCLLNIICC